MHTIIERGRPRQDVCKLQTMLGYKTRPYVRRRRNCIETEFKDKEANQSRLRVYQWSQTSEMIKLPNKIHFPVQARQAFHLAKGCCAFRRSHGAS